MHLAENGAERIANLMSDSCGQSSDACELLGPDELGLVLDNSLGEAIEGRRYLLKLVHWRLRHSTRKIAGNDLFGRPCHVAERPNDGTLQHESDTTKEENDVDGDDDNENDGIAHDEKRPRQR
jgi:hypothetical protein